MDVAQNVDVVSGGEADAYRRSIVALIRSD